MDAAVTAHPTDKTLRDYGLGKLDDRVAEVVSRHLDGCLDCQRRVAGVSSDSFLGRLRQAQAADDAVAGRAAPVGSSFTGDAALAGVKSPDVPAELAERPDYEILRELSGGGMGRVFVAHNHIMGRDEVLKIIGPDIIERPGVRDRFHREVRAVARLRHPNIVTAYSAFHAGASLVFAMEYVDGLDLARTVKAKGPMPVGHACYFVHQAALGLQHAHEAGMVHRDIKPGNLILTHKGGKAVIKILDFGLAKAEREQNVLDHVPGDADRELMGAGGLTFAGQMLGTPDFIAPEQIADAQGADIRADIYSLGCTLYYLLSGQPPFQSKKLADVLQAHRSTDPRLLNFVRPEVSAELAALVAKMMAKDPHRRFQAPNEVAKALAPFFTVRSAASVSEKLGVDTVLAADAGRAAAEPNGPGPDSIADCAPAPDTEPGMWSSLIEFKQTQADANGVADLAKSAQKRRGRLWPAAAASVVFAVLFGAAAFNLGLHKDRGKPRASLPVHSIIAVQDRAQETVNARDPLRKAEALKHDSLETSGPSNIRVESQGADRSSVAKVKSGSVRDNAPPLDPAREADRGIGGEDVPVEQGQEIASVEQGAPDPLRPDPKTVDKSMRWSDHVYVLDAEDDVHRAAATVTQRYRKYVRADRDLQSLKGNQTERKAWIELSMRQKEELRGEEALLRARMQSLDALAAAKRGERESLRGIGTSFGNTVNTAAIKWIDDEITAINRENAQCRERVNAIPSEQQELDNRLKQMREESIAPAQIQELRASIRPLREDYILSLTALREWVALVNKLYDDLADDPKVNTTVEAKSQGVTRGRYELGPSGKFRDVERKLKQHEDWMKATTPSRGARGGSKAAGPMARDLPPPF